MDRVAPGQPQRRQRFEQAFAAARDVVQVDEPDPEGRAEAAEERRQALAVTARERVTAHAAVVQVLLDLPGAPHGDRQEVPAAAPRRVDQRAGVVLGSAAVAVHDVQDAERRAGCRPPLRQCRVADRPQRIARDEVADHRVVVRMPLLQHRKVASARAPPWRTRTSAHPGAARTRRRRARCDSRRGSRARRSRSPRRSPARTRPRRNSRCHRSGARRISMQKPTPVGSSGQVGTAARASAARSGSGSCALGPAVVLAEAREATQISALLENGVTVPMCGLECAQRSSAAEPALRDHGVGIEQDDVAPLLLAQRACRGSPCR